MATRSVPDITGLTGLDVIGAGGFGTVYAAEEPELGRRVAVKVLHDRLDSAPARRAFVRECQAMGTLSGHPHIVTVLRSGTTEGGEPFIVMDLMTAGSLADRLAQRGPLPWPEVVEIAIRVAGALETAHRAGILHLDVTPANVMVSRFGEPKLGDFGISRLPGVTGGTTDGQIRASIAYAPPERLLTGTATAAVDLYSLGSTMFALLTGSPAFLGGDQDPDLMAAVARIVHAPVPDLRARGVPAPVAEVVEALMAKRATDRPDGAAATAQLLGRAQRALGRPVTTAVVEGRPDPQATATLPVPPPPGAAPVRPLLPTNLLPGPPPAGGIGPAVTAVGGPLPGPSWSTTPPPPGPRPTGAPTTAGRGRRRTVVIAGAAAVVLLGGLAGVLGGVLGQRGSDQRSATASSTAGPSPSTPSTTAQVYLDGAATGSSPTTGPSTTTPTPTGQIDPPADSDVAVAEGFDHPDVPVVGDLLDTYVSGINDSRYDQAFALFDPRSPTSRGGFTRWREGHLSSVLSDPLIVGITDSADGTQALRWRFVSTQDAAAGPNGQACSQWDLQWTLVRSATDGAPRILAVRAVTPPQPC